MRGFETKQIALGRYVIMPDHLHLFVSGPHDFRLEQWGRMLKSALGRVARAGSARLCSGAPVKRPSAVGAQLRALRGSATTSMARRKTCEIWERGLFDHLIRNAESYAQKWEYVRQNPVRAGLVERAEDWPYQGEIVEIYHA